MAHSSLPQVRPGKALNLLDPHFINHKYQYYQWLRQNAPVQTGRISVIRMQLLSRYEDCLALAKDPRFVRNRANVPGGSALSLPLPKNLALLSKTMIIEDDPTHKRLRNLVQQAFAPKMLRNLEDAMTAQTHQLLDAQQGTGNFDLIEHYALPIPVNVIGKLVGVPPAQMSHFRNCVRILSEGFSGWGMLRTVAVDLPKTVRFVKELIATKRQQPGDDLLSGLLRTDTDEPPLSESELISMVFLLIIAGYETTVHLIANGVVAFAAHPEQWQRLRAEPQLMGSAIEEILRFNGPIHGTKMNFACEDVELHGVVIPKGKMVVPLLGSANHDPEVFPEPERFDIARTPNRHLGFYQGPHFCLGAFLARLETKVALRTLLERMPDLRLAVPIEKLELQRLPLWHRYQQLPIQALPTISQANAA